MNNLLGFGDFFARKVSLGVFSFVENRGGEYKPKYESSRGFQGRGIEAINIFCFWKWLQVKLLVLPMSVLN